MSHKLTIITCSTRPGRKGPIVTDWVAQSAREQGAFEVEVVDLAEMDLPLFDEPKHPAMRDYTHAHTKRWAEIVGAADAFVFVTPEYDFFPPASVINAVQYLIHEWARKPAGVICYGGVSGGLRSAQVLRTLLGNIGMVASSKTVPIPFFTQMIKDDALDANEQMMQGMTTMLDDLSVLSNALKPTRG